jgi:hypothetical protein
MRGKMPDDYFFSTPLEDLNIVDHIHNQNPSASRLYLCNKMYPPPPTVTGKYDNNKGKEDEHPHLTNAKKYTYLGLLLKLAVPSHGMDQSKRVCPKEEQFADTTTERKGNQQPCQSQKICSTGKCLLSTTERITGKKGRICQKW